MTATIYAIIKIDIQSVLPLQKALIDMEQNAHYFIPSTDATKVVNTEWVQTNIEHP